MIYVTTNKKSITQQTIWTIRQDSLQKQVAAFKKVIIEIEIQSTQYIILRGLAQSCRVVSPAIVNSHTIL